MPDQGLGPTLRQLVIFAPQALLFSGAAPVVVMHWFGASHQFIPFS